MPKVSKEYGNLVQVDMGRRTLVVQKPDHRTQRYRYDIRTADEALFLAMIGKCVGLRFVDNVVTRIEVS